MFLSWWNGQYLEGKNWENNECIVQKSECNGILFIGGYSISPAFDKTAPGYLAPLHIALTLAPEVMMAINSEKTIPLIFLFCLCICFCLCHSFVFVFVYVSLSAFVFVFVVWPILLWPQLECTLGPLHKLHTDWTQEGLEVPKGNSSSV